MLASTVALAVLRSARPPRPWPRPLLLGIAFSASGWRRGGPPIGTPPNLIFMQVYEKTPRARPLSFLDWMGWGVPVVLVMIFPVLWALAHPERSAPWAPVDRAPPRSPGAPAEARVLALFRPHGPGPGLRAAKPFGGWSGLLGMPGASGRRGGPSSPSWAPLSLFPTAPAASF
jgi:sodium-dependent dicarboxylate transporter 2/3/5